MEDAIKTAMGRLPIAIVFTIILDFVVGPQMINGYSIALKYHSDESYYWFYGYGILLGITALSIVISLIIAGFKSKLEHDYKEKINRPSDNKVVSINDNGVIK